jgi:putative ABC transport system substrate-binding protein
MKAIGWEEGRNIRFLFVWAEGRNERAPALAGELVAKNVDLIISSGTLPFMQRRCPLVL